MVKFLECFVLSCFSTYLLVYLVSLNFFSVSWFSWFFCFVLKKQFMFFFWLRYGIFVESFVNHFFLLIPIFGSRHRNLSFSTSNSDPTSIITLSIYSNSEVYGPPSMGYLVLEFSASHLARGQMDGQAVNGQQKDETVLCATQPACLY